MRAFSGTLVALFVGSCFAWLNRIWLLDLWLSPLFEITSRKSADVHLLNQTDLVLLPLKATVATALLLTLPVFSAEAWLLLCRMTRREQARRLTVPFAVLSTGAALLALWLARSVDLSIYVTPL